MLQTKDLFREMQTLREGSRVGMPAGQLTMGACMAGMARVIAATKRIQATAVRMQTELD